MALAQWLQRHYLASRWGSVAPVWLMRLQRWDSSNTRPLILILWAIELLITRDSSSLLRWGCLWWEELRTAEKSRPARQQIRGANGEVELCCFPQRTAVSFTLQGIFEEQCENFRAPASQSTPGQFSIASMQQQRYCRNRSWGWSRSCCSSARVGSFKPPPPLGMWHISISVCQFSFHTPGSFCS